VANNVGDPVENKAFLDFSMGNKEETVDDLRIKIREKKSFKK